ncbi:MAG: hypothetical protein IKT67_01790 [Lachnospiraceae bacterium]|nr:hypothetical protein [Lachnospiraceae bacterium]
MRKGTKLLVTASVFAVAMNANACMYGPPPEGYERIQSAPPPVVENLHVIAEPPDWYFAAMGQYAVVRLLSAAETESVFDGQTGGAVCEVELLSIYNPRLDLGLPSKIIIPVEDASSFSQGDVLFVELGSMKWDGEAYTTCQLMENEEGAIYAPYVDNRLVLTERFTRSFFYESLAVYNAEVQEYRVQSEKGESYYMEYGTQAFEEGMTPEETEVFFQEFQKAKKDYEVVLNTTNGVK